MKREGFTQSGIRQWGSVHCVASSTITMGSCVPCERKEVTCVLDDVASVDTIYHNEQTERKKYHACIHQRGLLELLSKIAVGFGGESVRCVASELLDLPIHHPVQLVFLQERAFWMVFHARVAAYAAQPNDVRVLRDAVIGGRFDGF